MRKVLYILGQLTDEDVEWLAQKGLRREVSQGGCLTEEGKPVTRIAIILRGAADVLIDRGRRTVATLGAGDIVGEISLVDQRPATATVRCQEGLLCLEVSHELLLRRFGEDIGFSARFYRAIALFMATRMRSTVEQLGQKSDGKDLETLSDDEVDDQLLDTVHLAGQRFDMILSRLSAHS